MSGHKARSASSKRPRRASRQAKRAYRPGRIELDPINLALSRACRMSPAQVAALTEPACAALAALREGRGDVDHWRAMADYCNLAEALVEIGIGLNFGPDVSASQAALAALMRRVHAGSGWTLYPAEISALTQAVDVYAAQAEICTQGEHLRAIELVQRRIAGALSAERAGQPSGRHLVHAELPKAVAHPALPAQA